MSYLPFLPGTRRAKRWIPGAITWFLVALGTACAAQAPATGRPFEVDDLFRLESIGQYFGGAFSFAPDGTLAFTRVRPASTLQDYRWEWLLGNAAGDVWVQEGSGQPSNVTQGAADGSGWWAPEWSPDGRYLAMLSTRGGKVRVWTLDTVDRRLRPVSDRPIALVDSGSRVMWWLDARTLLFRAGPLDGTSARSQLGMNTPEILAREWRRMPGGHEVTASTLDSGVELQPVPRGNGILMSVDVPTGTSRILLDHAPAKVLFAQDGKRMAWVEEVPGPPPASGKSISFDHTRFVVGAAAAQGRTGDPLPSVSTVRPPTIRWSPDGAKLAIFDPGPGSANGTLHFIDAVTGERHRIDVGPGGTHAGDPDSATLLWVRDDAVLLRIGRQAKPGADAPGWLLAGLDGSLRPVRAQHGEDLPPILWALPGHDKFVGLGGNALVQLDADGRVQKLRTGIRAPITSIDWPSTDSEGAGERLDPDIGIDQMVVTAGSGASRKSYLLDLGTGGVEEMARPTGAAQLIAFDRATRSGLFMQDDSSGLHLWRVPPGDSIPLRLVAANRFLADIQPASAHRFQYETAAGKKLSAWLLLPPDIRRGSRIPLVTYVYPGWIASGQLPGEARLTTAMPMNMQIPVARGYAVLMPSMPVEEGDPDPMAHLVDGVLPALDKAMQMAPVDPDRVYLLGHSFGGYGVLGLLTQTRRFAAAAALAGIYDLVSMYGEFDSRQRYDGTAVPDAMFGMFWTEVGQASMGKPPWDKPERYIRNSPVFGAKSISTPVLLVHGDLDAVPIQQAEEMFTALYREGKRARFVRYWGEGHIMQGPANIRDLWRNIFEWFGDSRPVATE